MINGRLDTLQSSIDKTHEKIKEVKDEMLTKEHSGTSGGNGKYPKKPKDKDKDKNAGTTQS